MAQAQVGRARLEALTQRERDCLRLVLDQLSSKEIGRTLGISPTSVDTHVRRAREKLGVDERYAAPPFVLANRGRLDTAAAGQTQPRSAPDARRAGRDPGGDRVRRGPDS